MFGGGDILLLLFLLGLAGVVLLALAAPLIPVRRRALSAFPVVTIGLIALNAFLFFATIEGGAVSDQVARAWGLTPRSATLVTLATSAFLHGDFLHLFGNMLGLWLFGPHVEEALGRLEYLLFYIGSGLAAGLLHVIMAATFLPGAAGDPMIGASGALFGVLGLFAVRFYRARVRVLLIAHVPAVWAVGGFVLLQLVYGLLSVSDGGSSERTANWAHIGGFLFGMLMALPMRMREDGQQEYRREDAEAAAQAGRLDQAAAHYRLLLTEKPGDADVHRELARVCVRLHQGESAHRHYMDALRLLLRAGNVVSVAEVYAEALGAFEDFPLPPAILLRVGGACEQAQQYALALGALSDLCRKHEKAPEAEMALLRMGQLHLRHLGQPRNAQAIFAEFLRLYPESEWRPHATRYLGEAQSDPGYEPIPAP